ncbi:hypothetical protein BACI349Y_210010 [Bacillus sp. 349Y]|nr:hypothetical protein BACI349Y_210010 [Bacillus sp. 349Y]
MKVETTFSYTSQRSKAKVSNLLTKVKKYLSTSSKVLVDHKQLTL